MALTALGWIWWRAWVPLVAGDAAALCVAGVALGDIHLRFAWQAWHLVTWTFVLPGRRGTYRTGLDLVARLGPVSPSHASLSHTTLSKTTLSHTTLSQTTLSHTCSETSYRIIDVECIARAKTLQYT